MEKLNNTTDVQNYLISGALTKPFLDDEFVSNAVIKGFNNKKERGLNTNLIDSLICFLHKYVKWAEDSVFIKNNQFKRNAKEIWESGLATGCTDFAILFATFARQIGLATTILYTSEADWLNAFLNGEDYEAVYGHVFCECFVDGKWILVDPTCNKILVKYDIHRLELGYQVAKGKYFYIPYLRNVDMGRAMTRREYIGLQEKLSKISLER